MLINKVVINYKFVWILPFFLAFYLICQQVEVLTDKVESLVGLQCEALRPGGGGGELEEDRVD